MVKATIADTFKRKPKLIPPNYQALDLGYNYAQENHNCPLNFTVEKADAIGESIVIDGNTATALGLIYGGATVCAWFG